MKEVGKKIKEFCDWLNSILSEADKLYSQEKESLKGSQKALQFLSEISPYIRELETLIQDFKTMLSGYQRIHERAVKEEERAKKIQWRLKYGGCTVIKFVPCGKNCRGCPHGPYRYRVVKIGGKQHWIYEGKA